MDFHIPDTPKSKSRNNVSFKKENEEEDNRENKKYKIRLSDEEIKPKSPVREREVDFQDYMVRTMNIILGKIESLENENKDLKSKLKDMDKSIIILAETFRDKSLSHEEKMKKISKIQAENPNNKVIIERISSDGIVRIPHKDGTTVYMI